MTKWVAAGVILCASLLLGEGSADKLSQQKPHIKEGQLSNGLSQQKSIKIKDKTKTRSYPRGTIATH